MLEVFQCLSAFCYDRKSTKKWLIIAFVCLQWQYCLSKSGFSRGMRQYSTCLNFPIRKNVLPSLCKVMSGRPRYTSVHQIPKADHNSLEVKRFDKRAARKWPFSSATYNVDVPSMREISTYSVCLNSTPYRKIRLMLRGLQAKIWDTSQHASIF